MSIVDAHMYMLARHTSLSTNTDAKGRCPVS